MDPRSCGTVVVPIDYSESSLDAIATAREFVASGKDLHVLYVLAPMEQLSPVGTWGPLDNDPAWDALTRKRLADWLAQHGFSDVTQIVRIGDPGSEIADYARELPADMIVIPSHGYHGVKRLLLGSVAERVLRLADCPVLVLRRTDAD
ncbi:MAG: universal stress protein [Planctomycetales bacterium]